MFSAAAKYVIVLLVAIATSTHINAQVSYQSFNTKSGLPSNETYCAFQDKQGYMWFGTDHGIAKYNGYEFKVYTTIDGLTDNTVFDIKEDSKGTLYFLTLNGGICYYDGNSIRPHPLNDTITAICRQQMPTSWTIGDNKKIWLGCIDEGFYKIDSSRIIKYDAKPIGERTTPYVYVVTLRNGEYIYSMFLRSTYAAFKDEDVTSIDIYKLDWPYLTITSTNFQLLKASIGKVLFGIGKQVILLNKSGIISTYTWSADKRLIKLKQLENGEIWMSGIDGFLYRLKENSSRIEVIDSLTDFNSASDILSIDNGTYWVATVNNGVFAIPDIDIRNHYFGEKILHNKVSYLKAGNSHLYIPYKGLNIAIVDSTFNTKDFKKSGGSASISSITFDKERLITNQDYPFLRTEKSPYLYYYFSKTLHLNGDTFIAGGTGGLAIVNNPGFIYSSRKQGFTTRVNDIAKLNDTEYLIGTISGLYRFSTTTYELQPVQELKNIRVTSTAVLNSNVFATATRGNGAHIFINNKDFAFDEQKGLISNLCENVLFQNDSTLWVATYSGISKIVFKYNNGNLNYKLSSYTTEDGLCSNQVNMIELYHGYLWLATNDGMCRFEPKALKSKSVTLPLYITNVYINGEHFQGNLSELNFSQNNISIDYNALYYKAHSSVRYRLRLAGKDAWRYTNDHSIQYFGLPPGEYRFEVAAEDKFGRYVSEVKKLNFTIKPHFTQTLFFKGIIVGAILCIIALIIYLLFAYQRFKAQNVIKLLQSEFKALNYQINPHFIFNVLNSIQYYILRKDSDKAVNFLSSFSTLIRRIVSNSRQQYISVIEEVECLKDYLDLEKLRLENKFDYELNIDSNVDVEKKMMLPMILQPLVENSIWHGIVPLEEKGLIKVSFKKDEDGALICMVDDNGVGINSTKMVTKKEQNNLSLAMSNVKERLKIIGELNGSEWFINFMDKSELGNKERGTIVTIRFPIAKTE